MSTSAAVARARRMLQIAVLLAVSAVVLIALAPVLSPWLLLLAFALGVNASIVLYWGVTLRATLRGSDTDVRGAVLGLVQGPLSGRMLTRSRGQTSISIVDRATVSGYIITVRWRPEDGGIRITVVADTPRAVLNRKVWIAWATDWESVVQGLVGLGYVREA